MDHIMRSWKPLSVEYVKEQYPLCKVTEGAFLTIERTWAPGVIVSAGGSNDEYIRVYCINTTPYEVYTDALVLRYCAKLRSVEENKIW